MRIYIFIFMALPFLGGCTKAKDPYNGAYPGEAQFAAYGPIKDVKARYAEVMDASLKTEQLFDSPQLRSAIENFNKTTAPKLAADADPIDAFIGTLPSNYRRHFSMVHRSFSIQHATPMSPRILLYGPSARVVMTFNAGKDETGKDMAGGNSIEIMEYSLEKNNWQFSEITFDANKKIKHDENPVKCAMCHSGTPKTIQISQGPAYKEFMKPIFPQYPFWPGFYGSVNDIVGFKGLGSKDTIMYNLDDTLQQIKELTFDSSEELFRLRKLLDTNPKYLESVKNELEVHQAHFQNFMDSMPKRGRYKHLLTVKDLYAGEKVPESLKTAPYRRTFAVEYGHYLLRPNFYFTSLLAFYHAQYVARQIQKFPLYDKFKYSLLARKYNCGTAKDGKSDLSLADLDPTFDLVYPNIVMAENRDKQYKLAYQYNPYRASMGGPAQLPLHTWNMESNEDIASYHYGNVFSDLNELVLWNLASFAEGGAEYVSFKNAGRPAASERHYELKGDFMKKMLEGQAGGFVSRFTGAQDKFTNSLQSYYGQDRKLNGQPVSKNCPKFIEEAKKELAALGADKENMPHLIYAVDERFTPDPLLFGEHKPGIDIVRQSCEGCHASTSKMLEPGDQVKTGFNTDWYSDTYFADINRVELREYGAAEGPIPHFELFDMTISEDILPVPFGNQMPFARRPFEGFALQCEKLIYATAKDSDHALKGDPFKCVGLNELVAKMDADKLIVDESKRQVRYDELSLECRCAAMNKLRSDLYTELFPKPPPKPK